MITSDAQLHQAQTDIQTLWRFLKAARATDAPLEYQRLAALCFVDDAVRRATHA
jgi:hypothetical protein